MKRNLVLATMLLAVLGGGCAVVSSEGVDLSVRGMLSLLISRESTSATANTGASVRDNAAVFTLLDLADDQVLSVNGVTLQPTLVNIIFGLGFEDFQVVAEIGSVDAPSTYSISFDNQGEVATMTVTPPADFTSVAPAAGSSVSKAGFTATWAPSGETDVLAAVVIVGLEADGSDDDTDPDASSVTLSNLPDSGTVSVGASDLNDLLPGDITLTVQRYRTTTQTLGFASGDVRVQVFQDVALTLTN